MAAAASSADAGGCFLCSADEGETLFREGGFAAKQCRCGIVYIDPRPEPGAVDPAVDHHHRVYYAWTAKTRVEWLRRFVPAGTILDVGCGEGEFAAAAVARGYRVDGLDPSAERAAIAEKKAGIRVELGLVESAALPDHHYDAVFHVDLLSHFPDPVASLRAMRRCLKPGGTMCFEVGLFGKLSPRWQRWSGRANLPTHLWFYDRASLAAVLGKAGFRIVGMRTYAIGLSTIVSSLGFRMFRRSAPSPGAAALAGPVVRGRFAPLYYLIHHWLRYGVGRWLRLGGPQTALVAAMPVDRAAP